MSPRKNHKDVPMRKETKNTTWSVHDKYYATKTEKEKTNTCFTSDEAVASLYDWHSPAVILPQRQKSPKIRKTLLTHYESASLARALQILVES